MLTCECGEYLSTHGSSWSPWAGSLSRWAVRGSELPDSPLLFLGLLGSTRLPFLRLDGAKLSPGKSAKDGSTQRFSCYRDSKQKALKMYEGPLKEEVYNRSKLIHREDYE